ncbi:MAG: DNA recombination/repair protein RecA, partial [Sweet potato little leaf phytoplasma]|nr:DNA recombination/repair protein RecA [Sweet potato little leaf phytoplasma]
MLITTLALHVIAEAQKSGVTVAVIDAENSLDINYDKTIGV